MGLFQQIQQTESKEFSNIKDWSVFNIHRDIDGKLVYPREQYMTIANIFYNFATKNIRKNIIVLGSRGSGKTAGLNYISNELNKSYPNVNIMYVNAKNYNNSFKIMKSLMNSKKKAYDIVFNDFKDYIKNKKIILILDEGDLLIDNNLLYNVTRDEEFENVLLVLLTNKKTFYDKLDEDIKSSLEHKFIFFDVYNATEMFKILKARAIEGLYKHDSERLKVISAKCVNGFNSDVRVGLKAVKEVFKSKENNYSQEEIMKILEDEEIKIKNDILKGLTSNRLILLLILNKYKTSDICYREYCLECNKISKTYFFKIIESLEKLDLITSSYFRKDKANLIKYEVNLSDENIKLVKSLI